MDEAVHVIARNAKGEVVWGYSKSGEMMLVSASVYRTRPLHGIQPRGKRAFLLSFEGDNAGTKWTGGTYVSGVTDLPSMLIALDGLPDAIRGRVFGKDHRDEGCVCESLGYMT